MDNLFKMVKELELEIFNMYQELHITDTAKYVRHRELLNKIRYKEARLVELKKYLKNLSSIEYIQV